MFLRKILLLIFFCSTFMGVLRAQETISVDTIHLPFETLTINDGLSQGFVRAIAQDHDGFMWFGTKDGLNRYDGYRFTVFRHDPLDSNSIPENFVTSLFVDSRGLLWTGFLSGTIGVFDTKTGRFFWLPVKLKVYTGNQYVSSFSEDNHGNIWIIYSSNDLTEVQCAGLSAAAITSSPYKIHFVIVSDVLAQRYAINKGSGCIAFDQSGKIWKSVRDSVFVWDDKLSAPSRISIKELAQLPSANSSSFCIDKKNNRLLIGTESGISVVDPVTKRVTASCSKHIEIRGDFTPFNFDEQRNCWFLTDEICFLQVDQRRLHFVISDKSGASMTVLFIDRSGIVWFGTNGSGILKLNPRAAGFHHVIPPGSFLSVNKLKPFSDGSVVVNTVPPFLLKNENGREIIQSILPASLLKLTPINEIIRDTDGTYWCALGYNDLYNYDPETGAVRQFLKNGSNPSFILGIMFDHLHQMWIGKVENGIARFLHFEPAQNRITDSIVFPLKNISVGAFIGQVYDDGRDFWFTTAEGLFRYDMNEKSWRRFTSNPADTTTLSSNSLLSICPDEKQPDKIFWIGTEGGGLNRFAVATGKVNRIGEKQGLPNQVVYGILTDSSGNLWMSTNKGIACYNPSSKTFRSFVQSDGLQSNEFNRFAFCKTINGEMYFGGINGLNHFFPSEIKSNLLPPLINFTGIRIFNKDFLGGNTPVETGNEVRLKYSQNMITLEFAAMDFTAPSRNQYQYKLTGFNDTWINNGTRNEVTFTNLDPGHYTFTVKASNSSGVWNEAGKSLSIVILPPWWQTWWARTLFVLAIGGIIYGVYLYRIRQLLKMQAVRNRIAGDLHDEIGSTLSSVSIYSKVVQNRTKGKVPEAEPYLQRINSDISSMMEAMSDIVWTINSSNDRFENIFSRMRSSAAELLEAKNYSLHFEFDEAMNDLKLGMEERKNFYLIFKEALNNIAKYANGKNVWIKLNRNHSTILMQIRDDGEGFTVGSSNGNGMNTMKARAEKLKGELQVESIMNEGTTISLKIPIA